MPGESLLHTWCAPGKMKLCFFISGIPAMLSPEWANSMCSINTCCVMNTSQTLLNFAFPGCVRILRLTLKGGRGRQVGPSFGMGLCSKACSPRWVRGGGRLSLEKSLQGFAWNLHLSWAARVGGGWMSRGWEDNTESTMARTKKIKASLHILDPAEPLWDTKMALGLPGNNSLGVAPKLRGKLKRRTISHSGRKWGGRVSFQWVSCRQKDLFIILLFGRKDLTMAECKKYFFDKLKRWRKIRPILTENGV